MEAAPDRPAPPALAQPADADVDPARLREIALSFISDFAYVFDRNGRFLYVNTPLLELWGLTLEQVLGRNFFDLHYPDELAQRLQDQIEQVLSTGQRLVDETPYTSPAGSHGWYEYIFVPVRNESGAIWAVAGSTRDVTRRVLAERETAGLLSASRHAATQLQRMFDQAPGFMAVLRGADHVFELANAAYMRLVGQREVIGRPVRQALPDVAGQGFYELLDQVYSTGAPFVGRDVPVVLQREAGAPAEQAVLDFIYHPLKDADGQVSGIFVQGHDVTVQHRLVESLREADRRKDEFLAMLAHELRNPLAPLRNAMRLLAAEPLGARGAEAVELGTRQVRHMVRLIDDLLEVSRITRGKIELRPEPIMLDAIVQAVRPAFEERGQHLTVVMPPEPIRLTGDATRLSQVVENLLTNASKYTDPQGHVRIGLSQAGHEAIVEVVDDGIGIAPGDLPRLFELFTQVDTGIDRTRGGLGIGLALVRRLAEMHGGSVAAHSDGPGTGSRFVVRLPTAPGAAG